MNFFFFNDTATTEIYTLSLHDALPICLVAPPGSAVEPLVHAPQAVQAARIGGIGVVDGAVLKQDRKSTRLNSSHSQISYAVFCLKKKNIEVWQQKLDSGAAASSAVSCT